MKKIKIKKKFGMLIISSIDPKTELTVLMYFDNICVFKPKYHL